jgi:hypothetical protein
MPNYRTPITVPSVNSDEIVKATIAVANATGGATGATCAIQLKQADNTAALTSARQVLIVAVTTQYSPFPALQASLTFGTATVGSIIGSSAGWALVETSATGAFTCTATNTDDETLYFSVMTPDSGVSDLSKSCVVLASNSDSAAWSA